MNNARDYPPRFFVKNSNKNNKLKSICRIGDVSYMKRGFLYGTKLHIGCARPCDLQTVGAFLSNAEGGGNNEFVL
jgi:hypothetical protein